MSLQIAFLRVRGVSWRAISQLAVLESTGRFKEIVELGCLSVPFYLKRMGTLRVLVICQVDRVLRPQHDTVAQSMELQFLAGEIVFD
jgi:hypothetical protein